MSSFEIEDYFSKNSSILIKEEKYSLTKILSTKYFRRCVSSVSVSRKTIGTIHGEEERKEKRGDPVADESIIQSIYNHT